MIATKGTGFDIILVSGEPYADHPLSPVGMIARVLDAEGYKVGVIECPPLFRRHLGLDRLHARQLHAAQT
jgi:hypothetical protein